MSAIENRNFKKGNEYGDYETNRDKEVKRELKKFFKSKEWKAKIQDLKNLIKKSKEQKEEIIKKQKQLSIF